MRRSEVVEATSVKQKQEESGRHFCEERGRGQGRACTKIIKKLRGGRKGKDEPLDELRQLRAKYAYDKKSQQVVSTCCNSWGL